MTVHAIPRFTESAVGIVGQSIVEVINDVEIEIAVAIEVEEAGAGAPLTGSASDAGRGRHIGEGAVTVVALQDIGTEGGHIDVEISVVVVIPDRHAGLIRALTRPVASDAGLFRPVRE